MNRILQILLQCCLSVALAVPSVALAQLDWRTAPRHASGVALDPVKFRDTAIVTVLSARTFGWRGHFAVHPWILLKPKGQDQYTRHEVVGWGGAPVVRENYALPDGLWFGAKPTVLVHHQGAEAEALILKIQQAIQSYPYADRYRSYPGPNSNTFLAHIGREVPELALDLPPTAIGKDYRDILDPIGLAPSGSGLQVSLLGLLGLTIAAEEGFEFNILGLGLGLDFNQLAIRLPLIGRVGAGNCLTPACAMP
jgi:hypothetical protein